MAPKGRAKEHVVLRCGCVQGCGPWQQFPLIPNLTEELLWRFKTWVGKNWMVAARGGKALNGWTPFLLLLLSSSPKYFSLRAYLVLEIFFREPSHHARRHVHEVLNVD